MIQINYRDLTMENVYLARQPIINADNKIFAYDLLYRDSNQESHITNNRFASASVISNVLNKFGTRALLGNYRAFVKIDDKFLLHDMIFSIPKDFFIFALLDSVPMNERVLERLEQLHAKGYIMAINDVTLSDEMLSNYTPAFSELSYIKVNLDKEVSKTIQNQIAILQSNNIKVIGTKIEDNAHFELARSAGCDYFQGYFFATPNIVENAKYEPDQFNVIKLCNLLMQDTNIDEITTEFEHNHAVTVQLLQFINSGAFHFKSKISSIHHVLTLMGRRPLAQWLMLMIYSKSVSKGSDNSPLMLMVKSRTELMVNLLKTVDPQARSNMQGEAYFVGVLSLIDTLFGMPLDKILDDINVSDSVKNALLKDEGILGDIYALVRNIEAFNVNTINDFTVKYNLPSNVIEHVMIKSIENVNAFENALGHKVS